VRAKVCVRKRGRVRVVGVLSVVVGVDVLRGDGD
jgi:hypothetical protein